MTCTRPMARCPMFRLEKRPMPSRVWILATPVIAVILTMIAGGIMFAILGQDPVEAIRIIFLDPLFDERFASLFPPATAGQGRAADPDRDRACAGLPGRHLEYRRGGAIHHRRDLRRRIRAGLLPVGEPADLSPAWCWPALFGGWAWAMIPAVLKHPVPAPTRSSCRCCWSMWPRQILASDGARAF